MISAMRAAPLRVLFLAVAVAVVGLMTVADLPSAAPVHAQEQAVTATRAATGESPPARPTDLQASAEPDSVSLTWTASTDQTVTHYAVLLRDRDKAAAGVFKVIDSNAGSGLSYTDRSVSPGGSYVYRVKAVSPTGVSQWSSYARADIPADPEDLAPSGLSAKVVSGDDGVIEGVALAWDAPAADAASITGYEILRAVGDGDLATLAADTGSADTTYADDTATEAGESYAYRVKALRGEEASQPSDRAEAIIPKVTTVDPEPRIAEEQNVAVWSTTLPVKDAEDGDVGCHNGVVDSTARCSNSLTDDTFEYDNTNYSVTGFLLRQEGTRRDLILQLNTTPTAATIADLTLNIGGSPFPLSSASLSGSSFTWANSGLIWTIGTDVTVTLTGGAAAAAPAVSRVDVTSDPGDDDTYAIGETIQVTVTFDQAVTVDTSDGTPRIQLRVGGGEDEHLKWADYFTGTGASVLHFTYVVLAGDFDDNGFYIAADELELNGGTIQSSGGTDANLDYLQPGTQSGHKVDGVRPTPEFAATSLDGNSIIIIFSEPLSATTAPANAFTLSVDTGTAPTISTATASGDTVTLGLASALTSDQAVTVAYVDATSGDDSAAVQDAAGNDAVNFTTGEGDVPAVANAVGTGCSLVAGCYVVPADWGLIPTGLGAGAEFRLIFISSGTRNVASTDIADYNTFVQAAAAAGHADIQDYSSDFRVVGSTADVDARDNTDTTYTADDKGVAIHWLGGNKVADDYDDFYDETWDDEVNSKDESGNNRSISGLSNWPFTGSDHDGTERNRGSSTALGAGVVTRAQPNSSGFDTSPLSSNNAFNNTVARPLYGLSPVFRVEGQVVTNTAPAFSTGASFSTDENQRGTFQVTAMDDDAGDEVSYAITGGADQTLFTIGATNGLLASATLPDHENPFDADSNNVYLVTVTATGGTGARALTTDQAITVTVNDVDEPPSAPAAPTVSAVSGSSDSLSVGWTAPGNSGKPDIESYDLQYRKGITGNFADGPQDVTGLTDTISGLDADSLYQVQVRATNNEGDSAWSSAGSGTTNASAGLCLLPTDPLWIACLTVGEISAGGRYGYQAADSTGSLAPATFDVGTTTYTVTNLFDNDGLGGDTYVRINLAPAISEDDAGSLTLHLGDDTSLSFADATYSTPTGSSGHSWFRTTALGWSEGDAIVVGITQEEQVNADPSFLLESSTREVAENSAAGVDVGGPVTATDTDTGDTLTYTLEGTDAASFTIVSSSGQIQTKTGVTYDHELQPEYSVTVKADDGNGGTDTIAVTIDITDEDEPPSAPAAPTVSAVSGTTDSLEVTWTAPDNSGKPDIASYDLQYRKGTTGNFADGPQDVTGLTDTITGLDADSLYQVQVRATNDEGDGAWSSPGSGSTNAPAEELPETTVPADWGLIPTGLGAGDRFRLIFISSGTRNATATAIGDYNTFVQTAASNGHTDIQSHSSTFRVVGSTADVDARDNTATTYTNDDKGVAIYWLGGAKVADQYEDFYDGDWDDEANAKDESGSDRSTTLDTDKPLTGSDHNGTEAFSGSSSRALGASSVQLGSPNSSASGYGPLGSNFETANSSARPFYGLSPVFLVSSQVVTNNPPAFTTGADFSTNENQAATFQMTAMDADAGDEVTYAITGGADLALFQINATNGQLAFPTPYDHENPADADGNNVYLVTVTATGGTGARALSTDQAITVTVNDVDEPPAAPAAPTVSAVSGSSDSLSVSWTAPDNTGRPDIDSYDLRYRKGTDAWADGPQNETGTTATISGLDEDSAYQVQVRATNEDGDSAWSSAGSGTTNEPTDPTDADNLTATAHTGKIRLEWTGTADAYEFQRKEDGGAWSAWTAAETGGWFVLRNATTLDDYDVLALTEYTYQVRVAEDAGNLGEASATLGAPITLRLGDTEYRVDEGAGELFFTVLAETPVGLGRYDRDIRPSFTSAGVVGPLPEGPLVKTQEDYELLIESLRIEPGDFVLVNGMYVASRLRSVGIVDDTLVEGDETFELRLLLAGGVSRFFTLGAGDGRAEVTIVDNDTGEAPTSEPATVAPLTGFELVDATAHLDAGAVDDGATLTGIDPAKLYGFRANVASGAELKSVRLELSGPGPDDRVARTDNDEPYALHGDSDGHEHGAALPAGSYTLTATAHSEKDGGGSELGTLSVEFTVMGEPLTARFEGMPEGTHGGAGMPFAFRISFSEAVTTTPEALRDHALDVTNATVEAASRVDDRSDQWEVRLTPESDAMVTVSLLPAADCDAAGAVCTEDGRMLSVGVARVILGPPPNSPATGQPSISGAAQVGSTLTADTSGIADEDGLDNVTFSYQWMADDANIQGATGSSYTLADRDKGKAIKVRVSFTDDANNEESLTSAATDAVTALPGKPQVLEGEATAQEIELTWTAPTGDTVVEYVVYRGTLQNGSMNGQALSKYATIEAAGKAMTYTDDNVEEGVEYRYRVAAVNADGEGKKSTWLDIRAE